MRTSFLTIAALLLAGGLSAQSNRLSGGLELALPFGDYGNTTGIGFGATLGYEIPVGDHLGIIGQAGYIYFTGKTYSVSDGLGGTISITGKGGGTIPVQAGLKYYFNSNQQGFYLGALIGVHLADVTTVNSDGSTGSKLNTNFSYGAPVLGIIIGENIDIAFRYQIQTYSVTASAGGTSVTVSTAYAYGGLRAAYMFGGGGGGGHHSHHGGGHHHHH